MSALHIFNHFYIPPGKPQEELLCQLYTPKYAEHWKRIGILLGISDTTLQKIANDAQSTNECCNELWRVWVSQYINASWKSVSQIIDIITVTDLLQKVYKTERNIDRVETWASHRPEQVAKVSVICFNERCATLKQVEDIAKAMHSGNLNIVSDQQLPDSHITSCKITNCISDVFVNNPSQDKNAIPSVTLIEGAPGFGKTILSREIAFQWACENLLHDVHFLFLLHLRDLQVPQIKSLDQLVCYVSKLTLKHELVKSTVDYMERNLGQNCTMVFDGYDEISEKIKKDSLITKIIRRDILPLCHLVITSRPSASTDLYKIIDRRVEILGFTKDDRNEYICKNSQEKEAEMFQEYLQTNPFIHDLCYIPPNMTILLNLFKELISPNSPILPKTQTEVNCQFIYKTIAHFISQKKKKTVAIKSPDDLKIPYRQHFNLLCKLAFDLLSSEMVIFGEVDIQKYISKKAITNWGTLGLLREANYYSAEDNEPKKSYSFLHVSMQECLAAHYIAKDAENSFLRYHFWDSRYVNAGVMYTGLTKGKSPAFKTFLSGNSGTLGYMFDSDKAILSDKIKKLHLLSCLLEAKNDKLFKQLQVDEILCNNNIDLSNSVLQQKDIIHTLSFFLLRSACKHWEKINLSNSCLNDESLESFSKFFNSKVNNAHVTINTIDLSHNSLSPFSVDTMISLISCFKIQNIIVSDSVAEVQAFKVLLLSNIAKIGKTTISSFGDGTHFLINYRVIDMNINFLNQLEYKRQLHAWNTNVPLSIIPNLTVKFDTINVYEENLSDETIFDIASKLKAISEDSGSKVIYVLQSTNVIIAYGADFYQISQGFMSISLSSDNPSRKIVDMRECNIDEKSLIELTQLLYNYQIEYLDTLVFSECGLTASSISLVLEIFKCCIVKTLIISDNSICNKALCALIVDEITIESKLLNFKMNVPMIMCINEVKYLYFVNIGFSDATINDYDCVNSHLYFSSIGLNEVNIQSFLILCRNNKLQVNLFEVNITDEILKDVVTELELFEDNAYVLASSTRLIAFNAKHRQITNPIANGLEITTLKLINCEVSLSEMCHFDKLLSSGSQNWDVIDLSGCKIKDEGYLMLYEHLNANKNQSCIEVLNLSSNCLGPDSIITTLKIFEHCIIKNVIISRNDMPIYMFNRVLKEHLLEDRLLLNFKYEIPLMVYESTNQPPYEICNVFAFQSSSDIRVQSQIYEGNVLWNLYHVQSDPKYCFNTITSISLTSDEINVYGLVEGVMNEKISDMITECCKLKYGKNGKLSKVDFSSIDIMDKSCKFLCDSLFNDKSSIKFIKQLDFSTCHFTLACAPIITESFHYCVIKHLVLPSKEVLNEISKTILKDYHAGKTIVNFTEKIPLTVNIESEIEEEGEDGITYKIVANTYLQQYEITNKLFNHFEDKVMNLMTTSHTFILLDCLRNNKLDTILSILYTKASYIKIFIFELRLTEGDLNLITKKKETYRNRLRYVLGSDFKIVAYNAKRFHILQALQIKPKIYDLEITHCYISLTSIALNLIGTFNFLKNIKVIACKIKDRDFIGFCDILSSYPKTTLKTVDFSHNLLTSSSIKSIIKLLECSVIEKLITSDNSIDDTELTDAIYHLAGCKWSKICNVSSHIPLVIINKPAYRNCKLSTDRIRCVTLFHMNCEINKNLLLEYYNKATKMYFMNSLVSSGDLKLNLSMLCHHLRRNVEVIIYEKDLNDEVVQKEAMHVRRKPQLDLNFIFASRTKLVANNSSYHQITSLLESNPLINTLQLTNCVMYFPCEYPFIMHTKIKWETIDLLGCNIHDNGCLSLQRCLVLSKSTIRYLNLRYNNLSSSSAVAIANIILYCDVKTINISGNKLHHNQVISALSCLKQNIATSLRVEILSGDSAAIIISNTNPKLLPNQLCSYNCKIQLCIMHYIHFCQVNSILSSFDLKRLSKVILHNNCLTFQGIETIIKKLPTTSLWIQEAHIQYNSKFIDYSSESLMTNLVKIARDDNILLPFSSLTFSKLDLKQNKICIYNYKIMIDSVETSLTNLIHWQISTMLVVIKLSNCYIAHDIAIKLASFINEYQHLQMFELSYSYIQESDLKIIFRALQSTTSLTFFTVKSINCFIEDTAEDIGGIIARNRSIEYLEISNCEMNQSTVMKIARSIKELQQLKQLNLNGIVLSVGSLCFVLTDKSTLEELNLSHCRLQNPEISIISSALKKTRLTSINLSHNNISDYAASRLASLLLLNRSISNIEMSDCSLQENGMSYIINALKYESLKCLNFSGNQISDSLATELSGVISNNPYIMNLDLSNCILQERSTVKILTSLINCVLDLKLFKISSVVITPKIINFLEQVLDNCKSIETLTLQDCVCENIFNAVSKKISTLQFLDISSSVISFNNLISIVANNTTIKHLNVSNCDVQGEPDVTDYNLLGVFLEHLDLGSNRITTAFADFISKLISVNYKLKHLDIANCIIQEDELIKITNSLSLLTTLKYLNYSNIVLSTQVVNILSKVIANNVHLEHIDLSSCCLTELTFSLVAGALKKVRVLKYFKMNSNRLASDKTEFKSIIADSLGASTSIQSQSSIEKSEYVPKLVDRCKNSTKANDKMKLSTYLNTDEYATVSVGTHKYCVIPKSYKKPEANVYAPLYMTPKSIYMTPKKRSCDCSLCINGGVISIDKTSTGGKARLVLVDQCKPNTKTTDKTKLSNTDNNATISVVTGEVPPLHATIPKLYESLNTHVCMTTNQIAHDCSSSTYEDAISTDNMSIPCNQKNLSASEDNAVIVVSESTTHHYFSHTSEDVVSTDKQLISYDDKVVMESDIHATFQQITHNNSSVNYEDGLTSSYLNRQSKSQSSEAYENTMVAVDTITNLDSCNRNTSKYGCNTMSIVTSETTSQHAGQISEHTLPNVDNVSAAGNLNPDGYSLDRSLFDHNSGCESVQIDDHPSCYVDKKSLMGEYEDVLIMNYNENTLKEVDDAVSIVSRETRLQDSDKMPEKSTHVNNTLEYTDNFAYSQRNSESSATDCGYEKDDFTSCCVNRNPEHVLRGNHDNVSSANDRIREFNFCNRNLSTNSYKPAPETNQPSIYCQKNSLQYSFVSTETLVMGSKCEKSRSTLKDFNENVVSEVTQTCCLDIINSGYENIPSFENRTENTTTDQYGALLNRDKKVFMATVSESTLTNDFDNMYSTADSSISGSRNNSKCESSGSTSQDLNKNVIGEVAQSHSSNINSDYMRQRFEKSRSTSKHIYENLISEVNSSDVNSDYTNIPSFKNKVEDTATHDYDTLIKIDKTSVEHISTAIPRSRSVNENNDISSRTDNIISELENTSVNNHSYENVSIIGIIITEVITYSCFLEYLEISDCRLSDPQVATVATALRKMSTLRHLNLSYNQIVTDSTALKIACVITSNLSLKSISLCNCSLQVGGIRIITRALAGLTSLVSIDLSKNNISYKSMRSVAANIRANVLLEQLNLSHCFEYDTSITSTKEVNYILVTLTRFTSLKHLDLHSNYINEVNSKLLPVVISNNNKSLHHLDLTDCKLGSTEFIAIAKKLQSTFTLKYLTLSSNIITNEVAHEIALAISNLSLHHLALSDCKMEEGGLMDIAESLLNVSSLKHLDLSYSRITDKLAVVLASSIANNTLLVSLSLNYCLWKNVSYKRIRMIISKLPLLKEFEF